ncbi:Transglycosylase SLT domain protein [Piscirickettsia salmonis]|uniref:transglycosylase SLT domain-containing protein n=1 Tax=Piscirickettsia salmonis TaxID=1238 RepID=UPI0012BA71C5|nr:transglycosylase SLT domain-containing protein [Piscirickettsia salmonis]QGP54289.1 Transglycosylase SLT domain protein [Piscirickettsia salmonis]QGP59814.1 Transglycosylase SLT domain protein [Piscirickettsia salmonis]QGP64515.1 Transglycosylase SLT domain protein [Piscirickettsia salmonis]
MFTIKFKQLLTIVFIIFLIIFSFKNSHAKTKHTEKLENICWIFKKHPTWKNSAYKTSRHWKIPVNILMATIYQESRFRSHIKSKTSNAYGFAQATNVTWADYKKSRKIAHASRENFHHSIDFIGWYFNKTIKLRKISRYNTQQLYLYYQLGLYHRRVPTSAKKTANKVATIAKRYQQQLKHC